MSRASHAGGAPRLATVLILILALAPVESGQARGGEAPEPTPSPAPVRTTSPMPVPGESGQAQRGMAVSPEPAPSAAPAQRTSPQPAPTATPGDASRQAPPPPNQPCLTAEHAQLDFWLGEWVVNWSAASGESGIGTNRVVRDHGGCVVVERYQDTTTNFSGSSLSSYQRSLGRWSMTFMAIGGFNFRASGGPREDGAVQFDIERQSPSQPEMRIRFEEVREDSFTWRFQSRSASGEWSDLSLSRYTRRSGS